MADIASYNGMNTVFIDGRGIFHDAGVVSVILITGNDVYLIRQGNLGIRNQIRREKSMCSTTMAALHTADVEADRPLLIFDISVIVSMDGQACRMTTAAGQLVELKIIYCFIIGILRNRIAKITQKGYHRHVARLCRAQSLQGMRQKSNCRRRDFCCFIY